MTVLLAVSNDYWGAQAEAIAASWPGVVVAVDRSGGIVRSLKLVCRGSIPLKAAAQMFIAQRKLAGELPQSLLYFRDNKDLRHLAGMQKARVIILFRAGLIISGKTLDGHDVRNIHCADINSFGGLASVFRALQQKAYSQRATLHRVTNRIDEGEVLDVEPFELDPNKTYSDNEALAYGAGLRLLDRTLEELARGA